MIGTSNFGSYFIHIFILSLHWLAPLCILYCCVVIVVNGIQAARYLVPLVIEMIALAETLSYLLAYLPYRAHRQRKALRPPVLSKIERRELFDLYNRNIPDPEACLQKWFSDAPADEIRRENLKDFFLLAFFNHSGVPGDDEKEIEEYVDATEELLGRRIEPGRGSAQCLRLTVTRVDIRHRSFIWYWVSQS